MSRTIISGSSSCMDKAWSGPIFRGVLNVDWKIHLARSQVPGWAMILIFDPLGLATRVVLEDCGAGLII